MAGPRQQVARASGLPANRRDGAGYLPADFSPFAVGGDPVQPDFEVRDLELPKELPPARLARRRRFQSALEGFRTGVDPSEARDPAFEQAYRLITSPGAREAFDLSAEDSAMRAKARLTRFRPNTLRRTSSANDWSRSRALLSKPWLRSLTPI